MIWQIRETNPQLKILGYRLFYADKKAGKDDGVIYAKILRSERHGLTGKPDFIFKRANKYIPVELKSGTLKGAGRPHEGDVMQLACYFLIIEEEFGYKPRVGRIIYKDTMFVVKNTRRLKKRLLSIISEMRYALEHGRVLADTEKGYAKCRFCICRETVCKKQHKEL